MTSSGPPTGGMETKRLDSILFSGNHGRYHWLTSTEHHMVHLLQLGPDLLLGRYLAVTSIDSGPAWLTDVQRNAGWELQAGIASSQRIVSLDELFYRSHGTGCPGYDEWYVFEAEPTHLGKVLVGNPFEEGNQPRPGYLLDFVNWYDFALHDPTPAAQVVSDLFWQQVAWIQPEMYISDGSRVLTFVCKKEEQFQSVLQRLSAVTPPLQS